MQKDSEELPMEEIYDVFKIPVPISPPEPIEVSPLPLVPEVPALMKTTDTTNPTSTKIGQMGKYQEEEKSQMIMSQPPKEEVLSKIFIGKLAQGRCFNGICHTPSQSCGLTISVIIYIYIYIYIYI